MPSNDSYPQHVVTAVIVAHDGAAWLPRVIEALLDQSRPVQRVVAVDTGSRDRSGSVLAGQLGPSVVFGMERGTGYGAAVRRALQHRAANMNVPPPANQPPGERMEWVWLLHDDCEPEHNALEQLLRGAAETRNAAVLGPKVRDWSDRQVILEAGITIDTAGRRITGIEPREVDQGQHDGDRDVLAVGSPGMLIRRDVWDLVGGFDTGMGLFRDDVDFCWRVRAAGYRVRVITDAVVYHVEASARRRRPVSVARRPNQLDRRNAILTLAGNLPVGPMLASLVDNLAVSVLRALFFLVAKSVPAALDELAAFGSVIGHPLRLLAVRRRRARGRRSAYSRLRRDLPPGRSLRRMAEFAVALRSGGQPDTAGAHHAVDDPDDEDFLLTDTGLAQRILTNPGVLLFIVLTVVSLIAERSLLGIRPLGGGALVPAWGGASGLWNAYLQGFHPVGVGSGSNAPPYLAIIATLATVLAGKPWLAIDLILLGCVPLAGVSAFFAARRVTQSVPVRVWAAASYALLPVATGAIAAGRIGTAVVFVLAPAIAVLAGRMVTLPRRQARRAAWATGLTVAVAAAFVPLVWVVALLAAVALAVARPATARNLIIVVAVPLVLLMPWSLQIAASPSTLLLEAGLQQPGLAVHDLPAKSLLLLSPGGPGLPPVWVTAGIILAALAALLVSKRRVLMMAGWGVALSGLLIAVAVSRLMVTPPGGDSSVSAWPGVALLLPALGLLLAGATAGDALTRLIARGRPSRAQAGALGQAGAVALAVAAFSAPALAAGSWVAGGVRGPVAPVAGPVVPPVVAASANSDLQLRTLVLRSSGGQVTYSLQRGPSPQFGDPDLTPSSGAQRALATAVAALVATNGGEAFDQGQQLAQLDIGFVLLPGPVNQNLARQLDGVAGLRPVSSTPAFDLWRLADSVARVRVLEPGGTAVTVGSGTVSVSGAQAPAAGGTLELAEPAGGWAASLNGTPLTPVASPAGSWAQAFQLPSGGGALTITHPQIMRDVILALELIAVLAVAALALPGTRSAEAEEPEAGPVAVAPRAASHRQPVGGPESPEAAGTGPPPGRRVGVRLAQPASRTSHGKRRDRAAPAMPGNEDAAPLPRRERDVLAGLDAMAGGDPMAGRDRMAGREPMPGRDRMAERDSMAGREPMPGRDRMAGPDSMAGRDRMAGQDAMAPRGAMADRDAMTGRGPTGRRHPGAGRDPMAERNVMVGPDADSGSVAGRAASGWLRRHLPSHGRGREQTDEWPPAAGAPPGGHPGDLPPARPRPFGEPGSRPGGPGGGVPRGQPPRRPPAGQPPPRPTGQHTGWPQQPSGWPSEMLAPLPPPEPGRHGRRDEPADEDDDAQSSRWQVPRYDAGADQW